VTFSGLHFLVLHFPAWTSGPSFVALYNCRPLTTLDRQFSGPAFSVATSQVDDDLSRARVRREIVSELRRPCHVSKAAACCRFTDALRSRHDSIVDARPSVRPSVVSISCLALLPAATAAADAQPIFVGSFRTWTFVPRTSDPSPNLTLNPDALNPTQTGGGPMSGAG